MNISSITSFLTWIFGAVALACVAFAFTTGDSEAFQGFIIGGLIAAVATAGFWFATGYLERREARGEVEDRYYSDRDR
jgi:hypothetical protein